MTQLGRTLLKILYNPAMNAGMGMKSANKVLDNNVVQYR